MRDFSGGWRVRLNVAQRADVPLGPAAAGRAHEPPGPGCHRLARGLAQDYPGTLLLIAHDREFLDRVVNRIVNIEHRRPAVYRGNYSDFEAARAAQLAQQSALFAKQQREIAHMQAFVERFRASATKARQAQSRIKALERMQRIAPAHVDSPFEFSFAEPRNCRGRCWPSSEQSAGYGERIAARAM